MLLKFKTGEGWLFFFAIVGLGIFLFLYPRLFPQSTIRMDVDREEAIVRGTTFIDEMGYNLEDYHLSLNLDYDGDQLSYLNRIFGSAEANRFMTDSIPVFHWSLRWSRESSSTSIQFGGDEEEVDERLRQIFGEIRLTLDLKGNPISFNASPQRDEASQVALNDTSSGEDNQRIAETFAKRLMDIYGGTWSYETSTERAGPRGMLNQYNWRMAETVAGEFVTLSVRIRNSRVRNFSKIYNIPKPFSEEKRGDDWEGVVAVILGLLLFILAAIYFIQRLRSGLCDLKSGLFPAVVVILGYLLYFWGQVYSSTGDSFWGLLLGFVLTAPFVGAGIWALFSVGESLTREVWAEKLGTVDTLRRKLLFPELGLALFRGIALAALCMGVISLMNYFGILVFHGYFTLGDSHLPFWTFIWPSLFGIGSGLFSPIYIICIFCLFLMPVVRRRIKKNVWFFCILVLLWSFMSMPIPRLFPYVLRMGVNGLIGLLFILFFLKYDILTVLTGGVAIPILFFGTTALHIGNGFFTLHGWILFGFLLMLLLIAFIAYRSTPPSGEVAPYVPDYLKRKYETERIQRELEIARNVQLTFLPRQNPEIKGLDIASLCLPAKEVGGDYYDFIEMGPRKLGVVIGDVSGKGISAAFYMTLTKGFLKSQAQNVAAPRQVLVNMNELFYQNSERGYFISMIYGVIDLDERSLTFARAGHNPMILRRPGKGMVEELCPPGIALGLEEGDIFARTIEQRTIGIEANDIFLFYTDGLNEAQNRVREEFGEERLRGIVEMYTEETAGELLDRIQRNIERFTDRAPQHDDMTAVVLKIV